MCNRKSIIEFSLIPGCTLYLYCFLAIIVVCLVYILMTIDGPNYTVDGKEHKYYEKPFSCFALAALWEKQEPAADWVDWILNLSVVILYASLLIESFAYSCGFKFRHAWLTICCDMHRERTKAERVILKDQKLRAEYINSSPSEHRKKRIFLDI